MITRNSAYVYTNADLIADTTLLIFMPDKVRRVNTYFRTVLDSGATPLIQLFYVVDIGGGNVVLASSAVINATANGVLTFDYPPALLRLLIDVGPVAQNWNVTLNVDVFTEE
jgi:hypothetical protein